MSESVEIPTQYTHSVKLSETAKGIRIDVHVYANDRKTAIREAVDTYKETRQSCQLSEITLAPMEVETKK